MPPPRVLDHDAVLELWFAGFDGVRIGRAMKITPATAISIVRRARKKNDKRAIPRKHLDVCKRGHSLTDENMFFDSHSERRCRECVRLYDRDYRRRKKKRRQQRERQRDCRRKKQEEALGAPSYRD